jgi:hypothetical protein
MNTGSDSPTSEKLVYQAQRSGAAIFNSCFSYEGFQQSDIRVRTDDGGYALIKYRIRVHGRVCKTTDSSPCITDITRIELVQAQ